MTKFTNRDNPYERLYDTDPEGVFLYANLKDFTDIAFCVDFGNGKYPTQQVIFPIKEILESKSKYISFVIPVTVLEERERRDGDMLQYTFDCEALRKEKSFIFEISEYYGTIHDNVNFRILDEFTLIKPVDSTKWINPQLLAVQTKKFPIPNTEAN